MWTEVILIVLSVLFELYVHILAALIASCYCEISVFYLCNLFEHCMLLWPELFKGLKVFFLLHYLHSLAWQKHLVY